MANFIEIDIDRGSDFSLSMDLYNDDETPKDVSTYTFSSSIKKSYFSKSTSAEFTINMTESANGIVVLQLSDTQTAEVQPGRYVFDVKQVDNNGFISRIAEGIATFSPNVTE